MAEKLNEKTAAHTGYPVRAAVCHICQPSAVFRFSLFLLISDR